MKNILLIAKSTFKGIIKDKVFLGIIFCALLFSIGIYLISSLSLGNDIKITKDLGLAMVFLIANLTAIFFGCTRTREEIREKTYLSIISRPVSPIQFIIGKFLGLFTGVIVCTIIIQTFYMAALCLNKVFDYYSLWQLLLLFFEIAIVLAISILLSILTSDIGSLLLSITLFYIGHSLVFLKNAFANGNAIGKMLTNTLYYLLPNLEKFNIRNTITYNITPTSSQIIYPIIYSVLYTTIILWLCNTALKKEQE